jgi:SpoVK/Ycf46/Vps4 family AAA+-type ATPase
MLSHTHLAPDFSIDVLARRTDGLSGSDLRETCRNAAMAPVRELMREKGRSGKEGLEAAKKEVGGGLFRVYSFLLVSIPLVTSGK